jgi:glycosyltransferase involved in cell wall biosynthesis
MKKICIWMNMPSHHQSAFFEALDKHKDINLQVRYYGKTTNDRKKLGWNEYKLKYYEKYIENLTDIDNSLNEWRDRIHIIPGFSSDFLKKLIDLIIKKNLKWIHWSERSGVGLAKAVKFNYKLFNIFYPFFLRVKGYYKYAQIINQRALGSFAIGELAKKDFINWGIEKNKIKFQPYSLKTLDKPKQISIKLKKSNEKIFMYIGSLEPLKGIDVLLRAFKNIINKNEEWKLVLIGRDKTNGKYNKLAQKLQIINKVAFIGAVPSDHINEYLIQSDVFVLPTKFDGWGAVLNEAASMSKPLISTTQAGATYHLIENGKNGFIVEPNNVGELEAAMLFYIKNSQLINEHGKKSYEIFLNYTPAKCAELFVSNINELLKVNK